MVLEFLVSKAGFRITMSCLKQNLAQTFHFNKNQSTCIGQFRYNPKKSPRLISLCVERNKSKSAKISKGHRSIRPHCRALRLSGCEVIQYWRRRENGLSGYVKIRTENWPEIATEPLGRPVFRTSLSHTVTEILEDDKRGYRR
jgi:hypothetical protein